MDKVYYLKLKQDICENSGYSVLANKKQLIIDIKMLLDVEAEKGTMIVHSKKNIIKALSNGDAVVAVNVRNNKNIIIGFVYIIHWTNYVEVAGLVINNDFRRHGLGMKLFGKILELSNSKYPEKGKLVFANEISAKISNYFGFASAPQLLTNTEFSQLCSGCNKEYRKPKGCRCQVMILDE